MLTNRSRHDMELVTTAFTLTFYKKTCKKRLIYLLIYFHVYECFAWMRVYVHAGAWLEEVIRFFGTEVVEGCTPLMESGSHTRAVYKCS